jgi:hypothetical protein
MGIIYVGLGFMAFVAASTLAIDVGMFMTARTQAQTAADAGALAGAVALAFNSYDDRSAGGPAVQAAIATAQGNAVMAGMPAVEPADVTFPAGPDGVFNRVRVNVFRTDGRSNPIPTLIGPIFGVPTVSISATATGEAAPANAMTCVKPFTIPDRWKENQDPPWEVDSTFDRYDKKGNLLDDADEYFKPGEPGYRGYNMREDAGTLLTIRAGTGNNISPSMYWSWKMPGGTGADYYRDNIANCNQAVFGMGAEMIQEPGNMVGPTMQGIDDLLAKDPDAYWDAASKSVKSDINPSPRVFPIPLYNPDEYDKGKETGRNATLVMANWIGFFLEGRSGNNVYGRITPIRGVIDPNLPQAPEDAFPRAIRLVQ